MTCGFPPCTCDVRAADGYCAPTCRMDIGTIDEPCKCGHAECTKTSGAG